MKNTMAKINNSLEAPDGTLGLAEQRVRPQGRINRDYAIWKTEEKA